MEELGGFRHLGHNASARSIDSRLLELLISSFLQKQQFYKKKKCKFGGVGEGGGRRRRRRRRRRGRDGPHEARGSLKTKATHTHCLPDLRPK